MCVCVYVCVCVCVCIYIYIYIYLASSVQLISYGMRGTEFEMLRCSSGPGNLLAHTLCQTADHSFHYSLSHYEELFAKLLTIHSITLCHTMKSTMASVFKSSQLSLN